MTSFDRQSTIGGHHEIEFDDGYYMDQGSHHAYNKRPIKNNELMGIDPRANEMMDQSEHYIYITYPIESKIE